MVMVGDTVLVSYGSSLLDAKVRELQTGVESEGNDAGNPVQVLVQYLVESDRPDEWVTLDRVLEGTQTNRELQESLNQKTSESSSPSASFEKFCGPKRLDAMAAWMNSVDGTLVHLDQCVKDLIEHQADHVAELVELERRKKEAIEEKTQLEASMLGNLARVRVAEETAMARKRLQNAGIAQEEIDAVLPVIPHVG